MSDGEDETERIIKTAAKLIIENIRSVKFENNFYPAKQSMEKNFPRNHTVPGLIF